MKYLFAVVLLAASCLAAECPVKIADMKRAGAPDSFAAFNVHIQNTSGKSIRALKLGVIMYDATHDPYPDVDRGLWDKKIYAGKDQKIHFQLNEFFSSEFYHGHRWSSALMYVEKIAFEDGTDWMNGDNEFTCSVTWTRK